MVTKQAAFSMKKRFRSNINFADACNTVMQIMDALVLWFSHKLKTIFKNAMGLFWHGNGKDHANHMIWSKLW